MRLIKSLGYALLFYILYSALIVLITIIATQIFLSKNYGGSLSILVSSPFYFYWPFFIVMFISSLFILRAGRKNLLWKTPLKLSLFWLVLGVVLVFATVILDTRAGGGGHPSASSIIYLGALYNLLPTLIFIWLFSEFIYFSSEKRIVTLSLILIFVLFILSFIIMSFNSFCIKYDANCIAKIALKERDSTVCENKGSGLSNDNSISSYSCNINYALTTGDYSVCKKMGTSQSTCYRDLAGRTKNPELCKSVSQDTNEDRQRTGCCLDVYYGSTYSNNLTESQKISCGLL